MKLIIINSSNYVPKSGNKYIYTLPSSVKLTSKSKIGVSAISVYNSTFNVTAARANNTFTFRFPAATPITKTYTMPDGYYSVEQVNTFLQSKLYADNLYVNANNGANVVYFFEIVQNHVRYSVQLNSFYLPTAAEASTLKYTKPTGATWDYPASNQTPQLTFNTEFGNLIGWNAQTYPAAVQSTNQADVSQKTPNISPIDSYIITCNFVNSKYSIPSNVFFALPLTVTLGALITYNSSNIVMSDVAPNIYSNMVLQFYDQAFNPLNLNDTELVISIVLDDSEED
jgi:hypothetical protein